MTVVTQQNQHRFPTSSPPSSPKHFSSPEGSTMSSPIVATPQPLPPYTSSQPEKPSFDELSSLPRVDCGIELSVTLSSPQQDSNPSFREPSISQGISLRRKRSSPIIQRHRSLNSSNGSTRSRNSATAALSSSTNRAHPYHLQPYDERPQRRRDVDGIIQKPPPIILRRHGHGQNDEDGLKGISPGGPSPITIPSIPGFMQVPSLSGSPAPLASLPLPPSPPLRSKGHIQPSVSNVPRRRRKEPKYTEAELREQRQWDWERRVAFCEVDVDSGVFVSFQDDQDDDDLIDGFSCLVRIVQSKRTDKSAEEVIMLDNRTIQLTVPWGHSRDDGLPHLTATQINAAIRFIQSVWSLAVKPRRQRLLVIAPNNLPADAMAIAVTTLADQERKLAPQASSTPSDFMDVDRPITDVVMSPGSLECASPIHTILMRIHDLASEDDGHYLSASGLKGPWRGVISRDGMDFLASCF